MLFVANLRHDLVPLGLVSLFFKLIKVVSKLRSKASLCYGPLVILLSGLMLVRQIYTISMKQNYLSQRELLKYFQSEL